MPGAIQHFDHGAQRGRFAGARSARQHADFVRQRAVDRFVLLRGELHATRAEGGLLRGPTTQAMGVRVPETLSATIEVRLSRLRGSQAEVIWEDTGRYGGLEAVGDLDRLVAGSSSRVERQT